MKTINLNETEMYMFLEGERLGKMKRVEAKLYNDLMPFLWVLLHIFSNKCLFIKMRFKFEIWLFRR